MDRWLTSCVLVFTFSLVTAQNDLGRPTLESNNIEHPPFVKKFTYGLTLNCEPDPGGRDLPFRKAKYKFYKDDEFIMELYFGQYSLQSDSLTEEITGSFSCEITLLGEVSQRSNAISLLYIPPPVLREDVSSNIQIGGSMVLNCETDLDPSQYNYNYEWFEDNTKLADTGRTLTLSDLEEAREGKYSCAVRIDSGFITDRSGEFDLVLTPPPTPVLKFLDKDSETTSSTVPRDTRLTLDCYLEDTTKYFVVRKAILYKDQQKVLERVTTDRATFSADVSAKDAGAYSCSFANHIAESARSAPIQLQVTDWSPMDMTTDLEEQELRPMQPYQVTCSESGNQEMDYCTLFLNQQRWLESSDCSFSVMRYVDGNYSCSGTSLSVMSNVSPVSELTFVSMPQVVIISEEVLESSVKYSLKCLTSGVSIPNSQITWFLGDNLIMAIGGSEILDIIQTNVYNTYIRCRISFRDGTKLISPKFNLFYSELPAPYILQGIKTNVDEKLAPGVKYENIFCRYDNEDHKEIFNYRFYKNGERVAQNIAGHEFIKVFEPISFGSEYKCGGYSQFEKSEVSNALQLKARDAVTIEASTNDFTIGGSLELTCQPSTDLKYGTTYKWEIYRAGSDDVDIKDGQKLSFSSLKQKDAGVYSCEARTDDNLSKSNIRFTIAFSVPSVPNIDNSAQGMGVVHPESGDNIIYRFKCTCENLFCNPNDPFRLYKDGELVTEYSHTDYEAFGSGYYTIERTFEIDLSTPANSGIYVCTSTNYAGESDSSKQLVIPHPESQAGRPVITLSGTPVLDGSVTLRCNTELGGEYIQWTKDSFALFFSGHELTLSSLTVADHGVYACIATPPEATNFNKFISSPYMLAIDRPKQPTLTFSDDAEGKTDIGVNVLYASGQTAYLKCASDFQGFSIGSEYSVPGRSFSLLSNGQTVATSNTGVFEVTASASSYTCVVNDNVGTSHPSWTLDLRIADAPIITSDESPRLGLRNFVMTCSNIVSIENEIIWEKNKMKIGGNGVNLKLESRMTYQDEGAYTCREKSNTMLYPRSAVLTIATEQTQPTLFTQLETRVKSGSMLNFYCMGTATTSTEASLHVSSVDGGVLYSVTSSKFWLDDAGQILFTFDPQPISQSARLTCDMTNSLGNSLSSNTVEVSVLGTSGCFAGRFKVDDVCNLCEVGTYQDQAEQASCNPCPDGTTTAGKGSTSANDCYSTTVDLEWSSWSEYGPCSVTCGSGQQARSRVCPPTATCPGLSQQFQNCTVAAKCPASWSHWSEYGDCSVTCGQGIETRTRTCPSSCPGDGSQTRACSLESCPVNECSSQPNICGDNAVCVDTEDSYQCTCKTGFEEKEGLCVDINECNGSPCDEGKTCTNTIGGYSCDCDLGYLINSENDQCEDVDECLTDACTGENKICTNTLGSYDCKCTAGYRLQNGICEDIDECVDNPCSDVNSQCRNTEGSYSCDCVDDTFYFDSSSNQCERKKNYGQSCANTDACAADLKCGESSQCVCADEVNTYHSSNNVCIDKKSYEVTCNIVNSDVECLGNLMCSFTGNGNQCVCSDSDLFTYMGNNECKLKALIGSTVGESCDEVQTCRPGLVCGSDARCSCSNSSRWYNQATSSCVDKLGHLAACDDSNGQQSCQTGFICSGLVNTVKKCLCDPPEKSYLDNGNCANLETLQITTQRDANEREAVLAWSTADLKDQAASYNIKLIPAASNCLSLTQQYSQDVVPVNYRCNVKFTELTPGVQYKSLLTVTIAQTEDYPVRTHDISLSDIYTRCAAPGKVDLSQSDLKSGLTKLRFTKSEGCVKDYEMQVYIKDSVQGSARVNGQSEILEATISGLEANTYDYVLMAYNAVGIKSLLTTGNFTTLVTVSTCADSPSPCEQGCTDIDLGVECSCYSGFLKSPVDSSRCDDINECDDSSTCGDMEICENSMGSYVCKGYMIEEFKLTFEDLTFPSTKDEQDRLKVEIGNKIEQHFQQHMNGYQDLEIVLSFISFQEIGNGSVIADVDVTLLTSNTNAKGELLTVLDDLKEESFIAQNKQVKPAVSIGGTALSASMTSCQLREKIYPCQADYECKLEGSHPVCREKPPTDYTNLYIGLGIGGAALLALIVLVIVMLVKRRKNHNKKYKGSKRQLTHERHLGKKKTKRMYLQI